MDMSNVENRDSLMELPSGTTLSNGKYIIENKIGEGGFGITYRAIQVGLNRVVCIKEYFIAGKCSRNTRLKTVVPQENPERFEKYRLAFVREARMLGGLKHPNIVEVIDVFDENNTSYMVMSFINGNSLQSIVENKGPLRYADAINYIGQITNALEYVHNHRILHRDIKPDNIMITPDHKAILIDFGNAREFEQDKTQIHTSIFTKSYAPPEQYEASSRKGSYTDIYALGATLYFLLTGVQPLESAVRSIERMPTPKELSPNISDDINRTIMKAMQLRPENRHQTIKEFMDDLLNIHPSEEIQDEIDEARDIITKRNKLKKVAKYSISAVVTLVFLILVIRFISKLPPRWNGLDDSFVEMIWVEGGVYNMGMSMSDDVDISPQHTVKLDGFYISKYEITQSLWKRVMGYNPSINKGENLPVENITWDDAMLFVNKLNSITGGNYSLPTEAQWEYAARGGTKYNPRKTKNLFRYAGSNNLEDVAWYDENSGDRTQPVGEKDPNLLGIYDMNGNVYEWCLDWYDEEYYQRSPKFNPCNTERKYNYKVIRGFGYDDSADDVSCVGREYVPYNISDGGIGIRIVFNKK